MKRSDASYCNKLPAYPNDPPRVCDSQLCGRKLPLLTPTLEPGGREIPWLPGRCPKEIGLRVWLETAGPPAVWKGARHRKCYIFDGHPIPHCESGFLSFGVR